MNNRMYISGAISGRKYDEAVAHFADAEERVKAWQYKPVNPINNGLPPENKWEEHMIADLQLFMTCGAIYMIDGWKNSVGAMIEHQFAIKIGIPILVYEMLPTQMLI